MLLIAGGNDYGRVFPSENAGKSQLAVYGRRQASESRLNEIAGGSYTLLAGVCRTIPLLLLLAVLSSSFQHKSQLFSSAPAPEASSWLACHSYRLFL